MGYIMFCIIKRQTYRQMQRDTNLPAPNMTEGLLVLVQLVIAAITTEPWDIVYSLFSNTNGTVVLLLSSCMPKPCKTA